MTAGSLSEGILMLVYGGPNAKAGWTVAGSGRERVECGVWWGPRNKAID